MEYAMALVTDQKEKGNNTEQWLWSALPCWQCIAKNKRTWAEGTISFLSWLLATTFIEL